MNRRELFGLIPLFGCASPVAAVPAKPIVVPALREPLNPTPGAGARDLAIELWNEQNDVVDCLLNRFKQLRREGFYVSDVFVSSADIYFVKHIFRSYFGPSYFDTPGDPDVGDGFMHGAALHRLDTMKSGCFRLECMQLVFPLNGALAGKTVLGTFPIRMS